MTYAGYVSLRFIKVVSKVGRAEFNTRIGKCVETFPYATAYVPALGPTVSLICMARGIY